MTIIINYKRYYKIYISNNFKYHVITILPIKTCDNAQNFTLYIFRINIIY